MNDNFAIQLFEGKKLRIVWDAEKEKYYFAVADIVEILTESKDAKQYIKRMRACDLELQSKWGTICTPVEMLAPDGKRRKRNVSGMMNTVSSNTIFVRPSTSFRNCYGMVLIWKFWSPCNCVKR